nr:acetylcholine receptor subunit beta-type unc-29-like [Lytechinus pictus]
MAHCTEISFYLLIYVVYMILAATATSKAQVINGSSLSAEGRLIRDMVDSGYDSRERPLRNNLDVVYVDVLFVLFALFELDVRRQVISGSAWVELMWEDPRLSWNETEYDGIQYLNLDPETIWMPRVIMQNSAMESVEDPFAMHHSYAIIFSDGYVRITVPTRFVTFCLTNVVNFPFDNQTCTVTVSSPSMPGASFTPRYLTSKMGTVASNQWKIGLGDVYESVHMDPRINMNYSKVHFEITLKRKPYYFVINLVLPSSLINAMSLIAFWVPLDSGEKLSTAVSLLLGVVVFQIVVTDMLPVSDGQMPLLARYIFVNFLVSCGCVLSCVITLNVYKSPRKLRSRFWWSFWFNFLAKIVCIRNDFSKDEKEPVAVNNQASPGEIGSGQLLWRYRHRRGIPNGINHSNPSLPPSSPPSNDRCPSQTSVPSTSEKKQERIDEKEERTEMEVVAEIINRFIFLLFFVLYLCFLIYWFVLQNIPSSPIST